MRVDEPVKVKGTVKCPEDNCSVNLPADEPETYTLHLERSHPEFVLRELKRVGKIPEAGPLVGSMWLFTENLGLVHSKRSHNEFVMQVDGFSTEKGTVDVSFHNPPGPSPYVPQFHHLPLERFWMHVATRRLVYLDPKPKLFKTR
jgi:hypothetical protein